MGTTSQALASAISRAEGFGVPGAIPTVTNNPGDLKLGDLGYGTTDSGITVFPDVVSGSQALLNQVNKMLHGTSHVYSPDMTIDEVGNLYAGGDKNWSKNVSSALGVPSSTTLDQINNGGVGSGVLSGVLGTLGVPGMVDPNSSIAKSTGSAINKASSALSPVQAAINWFTSHLEDFTFIIVGLILIAAGVFAFKQTQSIIKIGGKVAELA